MKCEDWSGCAEEWGRNDSEFCLSFRRPEERPPRQALPSENELLKDSSQVEHPTLLDREAEDEPAIESSCATSCFKSLRRVISKPLRWIFNKRRSGSAKKRVKPPEKTTNRGSLETLPLDVREDIFGRLPLDELLDSKRLSKSSKDLIERDTFRSLWRDGPFTAITFFIKDKTWRCTAFNLQSKVWTRLPNFACLPTPGANRFKEYSVCGHGGLLCANVSKSPHNEDLVVFNVLTGEKRQLPSLHYPRNPMLIHILVDPATNAYKVVAAGSSLSSGEEHLSRRVEIFDSLTSQWEVVNDLPGPEFGLNEHQTGVCVDGVLYFIAVLETEDRKGVVAFDVQKGGWLKDRNCSVPVSNILPLVESGGKVYLFSEQSNGGAVEHCIDVLDFSGSSGEVVAKLKEVVRVEKAGKGFWWSFLELMAGPPLYVCTIWKLCIFNTNRCGGIVVDVETRKPCEALQPLPVRKRCGDIFFSLNPTSFILQPNFTSKP